MEIAVLVLLGIIVVLCVIIIFKKQSNSELIKELYELKNDLIKEQGSTNEKLTKNLGEFYGNINKDFGDLNTSLNKNVNVFKYDLSKELLGDFENLNKKMEQKLTEINDKVQERLDENFDKTNKTFNSVLERLTKIDEAQKNIDTLSKDIVNLQSVLTDKKTRGTFGEVNLNYILTNVFGEKKSVYDIQHKMPNGNISDAIIFAPDPLGTICIDSKFPLENYERMTNKQLPESDRVAALKLFKTDVKKHIDDIASKYIIDGFTSDEAIMFLPAEAIFAEINAYHTDLLKYAYSKKVWICGPTTLMSTLSTISMILKNIERDKYTKVIHEELNKLGVEFKRYKDRWDKLSKSIDSVSNEVKDIHTTTDKISKKFESISSVELEELEYKGEEYEESK